MIHALEEGKKPYWLKNYEKAKVRIFFFNVMPPQAVGDNALHRLFFFGVYELAHLFCLFHGFEIKSFLPYGMVATQSGCLVLP